MIIAVVNIIINSILFFICINNSALHFCFTRFLGNSFEPSTEAIFRFCYIKIKMMNLGEENDDDDNDSNHPRCLQLPLLNKQLTYTLLETVLVKVTLMTIMMTVMMMIMTLMMMVMTVMMMMIIHAA